MVELIRESRSIDSFPSACCSQRRSVSLSSLVTHRGARMEYRYLGASGLKVSALAFGTGTFGGKGDFFNAWGTTQADDARRLIDVCLDAGINLFDTADAYSNGESETILGTAVAGRRDRVILSTKVSLRTGTGPNDVGASRHYLLKSVESSLKRLQTDYIDLLQLHHFDAMTPVEQVLSTLDDLVRTGKVRYVGVSNFSGWQVMKSLAVADLYGYARYVANQTYYSLLGRDYEWELMPLGLDQGIGALVWSPLGWGRLTGRITRDRPQPPSRRLEETAQFAPPSDDERLYRIVDALQDISREVDKTVPQIAINWLLQRPTVSSVLLGARDERQLRDNLGAAGWSLTREQIARLDAVSAVTPPYPYYPYWNGQFAERAPTPV